MVYRKHVKMFKSQVESPLQNLPRSLLTDTPPILGLTRACLYDVRQPSDGLAHLTASIASSLLAIHVSRFVCMKRRELAGLSRSRQAGLNIYYIHVYALVHLASLKDCRMGMKIQVEIIPRSC